MLYCLQVAPTQEITTEKEIAAIVPGDLYSGCFHLSRKRWRKYHGNRHIVTERMMPGYIFIDSTEVDRLYERLKRVPTLTKLLNYRTFDKEAGSGTFSQLAPEEEAFIRRLAMGEGAASPGMIDISGLEIAEGNRVRIVSGPLAGLEERITRIDLHRGAAYLAVPLLGKTVELLVGVEDLQRTAEPVQRKQGRRRGRSGRGGGDRRDGQREEAQ